MNHRLLKSAAVALAVAATAVPLARATDSAAGNKSDYPQLFAHATDIDDGYKSGYPQLHAIHTYKATTSPTTSADDGYKSGYPQLRPINSSATQASPIETADRAFHWNDAAIGAGTAAALTIFLAAAAALVLSRRHNRIAV